MDVFDTIMLHYRAGRLDQARIMLTQVLASRPRDAQVHGFLSIVLLQLGEASTAADHALQATKLAPRNSDAWVWLGNALAAMLKHDEALSQFERALVFQSDNAAAWVGKMLSLRYLGKIQEAINCGEKAIKKCGGDERVVATYASALLAAGNPIEAWSVARTALATWPQSLELAGVLAGSSNYIELPLPELHENQLRHGHILAHNRGNPGVSYSNSRELGRRLRIGFVSSDLREHSVAYFIQPLLEHADRKECELFCYSTTAHPDARTDELRKYADHWREAAKLDDLGLCNSVRADAIDVLIDLHGYTVGHRLGTFCQRPAPVQATYCGYPNITGVSGIDYRIVDAITDPLEDPQVAGAEQLIRMRGCFLCYAPPASLPPAQPVANRPVTFGSFNAIQKISLLSLAMWKSVLEAVPDSRLAIKAMALREAELKRAFLRRVDAAGIDSKRVDILDPTTSVYAHLELYHQIDIALDTVPYNGTTTTCESLRMGVPVVTLRGDRHASRVSASLLTAAGFPQWIAQSPEEFKSIAQALANNANELRALRTRVPAQLVASSLCDGESFSRRFLDTVRVMWTGWAAKTPT